jgi:L-arabonate dehydrase
MIRISDARMSRTAGGALAPARNSDFITLDIPERLLRLPVRRAAWLRPARHAQHGYARMSIDHVMRADGGADFDLLAGRSGPPCRVTIT